MHTIGEPSELFLISFFTCSYFLQAVVCAMDFFSSYFSAFSVLFQSHIQSSLNVYTWHILNAEWITEINDLFHSYVIYFGNKWVSSLFDN